MTERDLAYMYPERPRTAPVDREWFDPPTNWVNYWDMNPIAHGLTAIRWDGDEWDVVEVVPPSAFPDDVPGTHHVERMSFSPRDVWDDPGDPLTEWSDAMQSEIDAYGSRAPELPNGKPFVSDVTYYVAGLTNWGRGRTDTLSVDGGADADPADYWSAVPEVDPGEIEGVSSRSLPPEHRDDDD